VAGESDVGLALLAGFQDGFHAASRAKNTGRGRYRESPHENCSRSRWSVCKRPKAIPPIAARRPACLAVDFCHEKSFLAVSRAQRLAMRTFTLPPL